MQQEPPKDMFEDTRAGMDFVLALARVWSISIEVFIRRQLGVRYPGLLGVFVLGFVPIYACFWEGYNILPLVRFAGAYFLMCACHRLCMFWKYVRGIKGGHSYYNGFPIICSIIPWFSESFAKLFVEPALVLLVGLWCRTWNEPLGCYLVGGAISLLVSDGLSRALHRNRLLDMQDATIEQQILAERFRQSAGGSFN